MGYSTEPTTATLELSYAWDTPRYQMGCAFGHLAVAVDDLSAAVDEIRARGGRIVRGPHTLK